jgi:hypothetical protein
MLNIVLFPRNAETFKPRVTHPPKSPSRAPTPRKSCVTFEEQTPKAAKMPHRYRYCCSNSTGFSGDPALPGNNQYWYLHVMHERYKQSVSSRERSTQLQPCSLNPVQLRYRVPETGPSLIHKRRLYCPMNSLRTQSTQSRHRPLMSVHTLYNRLFVGLTFAHVPVYLYNLLTHTISNASDLNIWS